MCDPVSQSEIDHDIASMRGPDLEALEAEIVQRCEDLEEHDWVHENGRDPADFQLEIARLCFATDAELDIFGLFGSAERLARIKQLFRLEFQFYAEKRARREASE